MQTKRIGNFDVFILSSGESDMLTMTIKWQGHMPESLDERDPRTFEAMDRFTKEKEALPEEFRRFKAADLEPKLKRLEEILLPRSGS